MESKVVVYKPEGTEMEFGFPTEGETGWATQAQLAEVFEISQPTISRHADAIFDDGELDQNEHIRKTYRFEIEGKREVKREVLYYSLSAAIALGFRVHSKRAIEFRRWANVVIRELIEGKLQLKATEKADDSTYALLERSKVLIGELAGKLEVAEFNVAHKRGALSTSQHVGVSYVKQTNRWRAYLYINGEFKLNKSFLTEREAVEARREAEERWCGKPDHDLPSPKE
jgi:hypothetical protein